MRCPGCSREDTSVIDSRPTGTHVRRRRKCKYCGERFTTREELARDFPKLVKRDKRREDYQQSKLRNSITLALHKTDVPESHRDELVSAVEKLLLEAREAEYSTQKLGAEVMERLRAINHVAYVRYASVYLGFEDLSEFIRQIEDLQGELDRERLSDRQLSLDL